MNTTQINEKVNKHRHIKTKSNCYNRKSYLILFIVKKKINFLTFIKGKISFYNML
jgi:hypothetical protein